MSVDITKLEQGTHQYNAATDLIGGGVDFDCCNRGHPETIKRLSDMPIYNNYNRYPWAASARLDNQGDINCDNKRYYINDVMQIGEGKMLSYSCIINLNC